MGCMQQSEQACLYFHFVVSTGVLMFMLFSDYLSSYACMLWADAAHVG